MEDQQENKPPLFATWTHWYVLVLVFLGLLIILFTFFTNYFS